MTVRGLEIRFERLLFGARWLSLIGNLLMVVMLAGHESLVSQLHIDAQEDRPEWLGTIARTPDHSAPQR